ncbi:hypothetical protein ACOMHN_026094 [Nucella lapillus]
MTNRVTMGLMTCLLLIGLTYATSIRTSAFEIREQYRQIAESMQKDRVNRTSDDPRQAPLYIPHQCRKLACPPTKLLADRGSYTKVFFPHAVWAKVRVTGKCMMSALFESYNRLRKYYDGNNADDVKLPMTAPVILRVDPAPPEGMFNPRNFTLFFYMDPRVKSPPTPNDADITVLTLNTYSLYIRTFSSYTVSYSDWMRELLQLSNDVEANGELYRKEYYYFTTYDSPLEVNNRINEAQLLVPADGEPLGL